MPTDIEEYEKSFDNWLALLTTAKFLTIAYGIAAQNMMDIFFIDWEPPRNYSYQGNMAPRRTTSPWRRLFLANEFTEM
jgi:hypothetical protein